MKNEGLGGDVLVFEVGRDANASGSHTAESTTRTVGFCSSTLSVLREIASRNTGAQARRSKLATFPLCPPNRRGCWLPCYTPGSDEHGPRF